MTKMKQLEGDLKLSKLENESVIKQLDTERKQKPGISTEHQSSTKTPARKAGAQDVSESYLDMSYSQSPSFIHNRKSSKYTPKGGLGNTTLNDRDDNNENSSAKYNYQMVDKTE